MNHSKTKTPSPVRALAPLTHRAQSVLDDLVEIYSATGVAVGSKALCDRSKLGLSSASFRHIMADLEDQGLLLSPHTSAGRVPTEQGFRYYVQGLVREGDLDAAVKQRLDAAAGDASSSDEAVRNVTAALGELTSCAGLVTAPRFDFDPLDRVEFVRLAEHKVLAVMVTEAGSVENRVIHVPEQVDMDSLTQAAKRLKDVVGGKTLADARVMMMEALMEHKHRVDSMMENMMLAAEQWGEPTVTDGALMVAGSQNLFQYPELVRDQLRDLIRAFDEKRMLMALMNEVQKGEGVQVFVGSDCPLNMAKECAVVASRYTTPGNKVLGTLGVIGPMRMNYRQAIQVVDYAGVALGRVLEKK